MSRAPGSTGRDPFRLDPRTPGPLGCGDAASPDPFRLLGDTPGPLGRNDCAGPDADPPYGLGIPRLHATLSRDEDLFLWDDDPDRLLDDDRLNPEFLELAHRALKWAVECGLRAKVFDAYRGPRESDRKHAKFKRGVSGKAASGWESVESTTTAWRWTYGSTTTTGLKNNTAMRQ